VKTHSFRGKRYRIHTDVVVEGYCAGAEARSDGEREIYISAALKGRRRLEVAIHEALHAEDPDVCETVIERRAAAVASFLWRMGYKSCP
jgi:hypothetical protein